MAFFALASALSLSVIFDDVPNRPEDAKPIAVGALVPDVKVLDLEGNAVSTRAIAAKPTVFVFYRGGWCPFCNRHLSDLRNAESGLKELGYQLVAISPDLPAEITRTMGKDKLDYTIYSDSSAAAMKAFGVAFTLDQKTVTLYKENYKIDLEKSSGQSHHILPVPSVFISNAKGEIRFAHANPDYRIRLSAQEVLEAAKKAL